MRLLVSEDHRSMHKAGHPEAFATQSVRHCEQAEWDASELVAFALAAKPEILVFHCQHTGVKVKSDKIVFTDNISE